LLGDTRPFASDSALQTIEKKGKFAPEIEFIELEFLRVDNLLCGQQRTVALKGHKTMCA
jgi:hypothetical protein